MVVVVVDSTDVCSVAGEAVCSRGLLGKPRLVVIEGGLLTFIHGTPQAEGDLDGEQSLLDDMSENHRVFVR